MERTTRANEGGTSPDAAIGRSSSEEERNRQAMSTSGEYVTTVGGSSSSLDTVVSQGMEEKKKGRFGTLKSSFSRRELFKIKKKGSSKRADSELTVDQDDEEGNAKGFPLLCGTSHQSYYHTATIISVDRVMVGFFHCWILDDGIKVLCRIILSSI